MLLRTFLAPTSFVAAVIWTIWAQAAEPITVLAPFNLTGPQAVLGAPCYRGAELALRSSSERTILNFLFNLFAAFPFELNTTLSPSTATSSLRFNSIVARPRNSFIRSKDTRGTITNRECRRRPLGRVHFGNSRGHRLMRLILEPSRLKLYISPCGSRTKAMMGRVRVSVSMAPPAPAVTRTIDPSTQNFQPSAFRNPARDFSVMNMMITDRDWTPSWKPKEAETRL